MPTVAGVVLTLAMVAGLARALGGRDLAALASALPRTPLYYAVFALLYATQPLAEYAIFRRIWRLPPPGLVALARKRIIDEVVFGYAGEAWFYTWATTRGGREGRAFAGIKDVAILSALAGNLLTVTLALAAIPVAWHRLDPMTVRWLGGAIALMLAGSVPFLVFRRRVFSLGGADLRWIFAVQLARFVTVALLTAFAWAAALPGDALGIWVLLSAGRLIVSRLPIPGKELLFATLAVALLGGGEALSGVIAVTAALTLAMHGLLIVLIGGGTLVSARLRKRHRAAPPSGLP